MFIQHPKVHDMTFLVNNTQIGYPFGCVDLKSTRNMPHGNIKYTYDISNDADSLRTLLATCMLHMSQHQTTH